MSLGEQEISDTKCPLGSSIVSGSVCPESLPQPSSDRLTLSEGAASLRLFIHSLPVAAFTCDEDGRVILYNQAAVTLWDREPHAMKDMWCVSCRIFKTDGTQLPTDQCPITLALRENRPINDYEIIIERPDGSQRNVLSYVEPIRNLHGKSQGAVVLLVDVTEHKRNEHELRRSESELRDFVETSNIGLHWVAADGRILWANQAELTLLGYAPEEYIGHHIAEFHADLPVIENILACSIRGENIRDQAARLRCKDGSIRYVLINSSVLFRNGEFVHTRCFTHDITETKHVEEQRVQLLAREWAAREEAETLLEMSRKFLTETDVQKLLKVVTDTGRELTKAQFSMFVYKAIAEGGKTSIHYAVAGAPRETFLDLRDVRYATLLDPIFSDTGVRRIHDLLDNANSRNRNFPFAGLLGKYLPVRSYLEVPVVSRAGEILGRLFFGHPEPDMFSERAERLAKGIAAQGAIALDNERLLTQRETRERRFREMIDALPAAVYTTDAEGKLTHYNQAAITFSGQIPQLGTDQWCVSWKLFRSDGSPLPHDECPMAIAVKEGRIVRGVEAIAERPDGTRLWFMPYPTPLRDAQGHIVGGINMLIDITERKQLEGAIGHLAAIVASSDDAILSKDLSGIIKSWNKGAERLYGYRADEMIGQSVYRIIPSHRQEEESFILDRIAQGERIVHYETVRLHKDGRSVYVSLSVSPILNQEGRPIGASTIARDITETKSKQRQQQCLFELATAVNQSATIAEIYEKALDAIIRALQADRAAILLYAQDDVMRFKASRGLSQQYQRAVEGHSPWKKDDPLPSPVVFANIDDARIDRQLKSVVMDEGIRALAFIPLTYGRQLIGKFMVYFDSPYAFSNQDIEFAQTLAHTLASGIERKRADEVLRQELSDTKLLQDISASLIEEDNVQNLYEKLLDAAISMMRSDLASMQTVHGQEDILRSLACRGVEPNSGQVSMLDHPEINTSCSLARHRGQRVVIPDVESCDIVMGMPALDAHRKMGIRAVQSTPLISRSGKMVGMISTYWRVPHQPSERNLDLLDILARQAADLIERKQAEDALRQSETQLRCFAAELEHLVADRTEELVQSQSRLRALATELNLLEQRERQRIATELHDHLQQLLVLGKIKLGQGKRVVESVPACADIMKQVDDVLSDALKYTRTLVAELSPPVLRDHGLPAALKWLAEQMRHHQLTVSLDLQTEELNIPENHAVLLFQSVRELLINAAKHAGTGEATVRVARMDHLLSIEVQDHGKGFDPRAAAEAAEATVVSSKFGLFSIRERMKSLGGAFEIESPLGVGTTAKLILPISDCEAGRPKAFLMQAWTTAPLSSEERKHGDDQSEETQPPRSVHVVLADDHRMMRQGLRAVLEAYSDVQVVGEAKDGEEALILVDKLRPSVVVMDINMPRLNGIDATTLIKARHPHVKVIGLSVNAGTSNQEAMKQAGAHTLLTKETAVEELYRAIQQTLKEDLASHG